MGLVAVIEHSKIVFVPNSTSVYPNVVTNWVTCRMPLFGLYYDFAFGKAKNIRPPKFAQLWEVGIVQNVLFDKIKLVYEDDHVYRAVFDTPAVDVADKEHAPFLHGPIELLPPEFQTPVKDQTSMIPVRKVWYTSRGIG